ncbi:MAG: hemolysin III family protein [Planctomycetes bacterium]|nr:hemolysin III family protein [Planctomycetota bacterium]
MSVSKIPRQSKYEEYLNGLTHGIGFFVCFIASPYLLSRAYYSGLENALLACTIFCGSMLVLYGSSTVYHLTRSPQRKMRMRSLDHICIFVLIAGSYTPFALISLPTNWGATFFIAAWLLATVGIALKIFFFERFEKASYVLYLAMGWMAVIGYKPLHAALGDGGMAMLAGGGIAYTLGITFFLFDQRVKFFHALWHLFVLAGSGLHFLTVYKYVI